MHIFLIIFKNILGVNLHTFYTIEVFFEKHICWCAYHKVCAQIKNLKKIKYLIYCDEEGRWRILFSNLKEEDPPG